MTIQKFSLPGLIILSLMGNPIAASGAQTEQLFNQAVELQKQGQTLRAIQIYRRILRQSPFHARAHYEIGWSYWKLEKWEETVKHWEQAQTLNLQEPNLNAYLASAREQLKGRLPALVRAPIGTSAEGQYQGGPFSLSLVARFQHYNPEPQHAADHFDAYVFSPKSVQFHPDGNKAYVNALEGFSTLVYDPDSLKRIARIYHRFDQRNQGLFQQQAGPRWFDFPTGKKPTKPNHFYGKPVESTFSHQGKYLWVPYYRRDYDKHSTMPSALALIETATDRIIRVFETGPIPKYVTTSPDGKWLAVSHWGDNTVGLIDIRGDDPVKFRRAGLVTIGHRLKLSGVKSTNRDNNCGYCLRGTVFTADSQYLLVARMGGGGIAVVDIERQRYLGALKGIRPTPRHLLLSNNGQILYVSSNLSGYVASFSIADILDAVKQKQFRVRPLREIHTGPATRTIALSPDNRFLFAAVNLQSKIVALSADTLEKILEIPSDSYPVGMTVSPDGTQLWVTAQGRKLRGGNSVSVYTISPP